MEQAPVQPQSQSSPRVPQPEYSRPTLRVWVLAVIFTLLTMLWSRSVDLVNWLFYLADIIPSFPAIFFVACLIALGGLATAVGRGALNKLPLIGRCLAACRLSVTELLALYAFLMLSTVWPGVGMVRFIFPCLTVMQYYQVDRPQYGELAATLPSWVAPSDPEVVRQMWEGMDVPAVHREYGNIPLVSEVIRATANLADWTARVPWLAWLGPTAFLYALLIPMYVCFYCIVCMFRERWVEHERLAFPLAQLPVILTSTGEDNILDRPFFKDGVMWAGLSLAVIFNALHVITAFAPSVPRLERHWDIFRALTEMPWNRLNYLTIWIVPELIGIGYLMPNDILFSVWFFYLASGLSRVVATHFGLDVPGYPWEYQQGIGAYMMLFILIVWVTRRHLAEVIRRGFQGAPAKAGDPIAPRTMLIGAVAGFIFITALVVAAGMDWWMAAAYLGLTTAWAVVIARARAEGGTPVVYMFPYEQTRRAITIFTPTNWLTRHGYSSVAMMNVLYFLSAGQFPNQMGTQVEAMRIASLAGIDKRAMTRIVFWAIAIGLGMSLWIHLATYYEFGCNVLEGGTTDSGYRTGATRREFDQVVGLVYATTPQVVTRERNAAFFGGGLVLLMYIVKMFWLKSPFHPIGYGLAMYRGAYCWGPFLITWLIRSIIVRLGGRAAYRRVLPAFVGFALGHFLANGVLIGILGIFYGQQMIGVVDHVRSH